MFYNVFKSITVDNGSEFADYEGERIENWINSYPRRTLGYCSSRELFERELSAI